MDKTTSQTNPQAHIDQNPIDGGPTNFRLGQAAGALASYRQISTELASQICSGTLLPGTRLPSERELAAQLGVSRITARQAMEMLRELGLVVRRQGRGTFVRQPVITQWAGQLLGFFDQMRRQGLSPSAEVLQASQVPAAASVAQALQVQIGSPVFRLQRRLLGGGVPLGVATSYMPARLFPDFLSHDLTGSLFELLGNLGAPPWRAEQTLQPVAAIAREAEMLLVPMGAPLMLMRRVSWDPKGEIIEHGEDFYRQDAGCFVVITRAEEGNHDPPSLRLLDPGA